ncbi:uncharacterized protein LOC62_08G009834 [Vanrija pseudolonga]|uniref:Uncharacterized protein n=1 Tax=Vanrija pseudolonga TaxID=143232 RepID=A0AAF1BQT4_9TREE|nr:hypothetical protein LOC62_08G009834 [Vanrija pseudolonga]
MSSWTRMRLEKAVEFGYTKYQSSVEEDNCRRRAFPPRLPIARGAFADEYKRYLNLAVDFKPAEKK